MRMKADRWNWALATGALMAFYSNIVGNQPSSLSFFVFLIIQPVCVCLGILGLYSLIVHKSAPILGAVIGAMLYVPIILLSVIIGMMITGIFVTTSLNKIVPDILKIPLLYTYLVPLGLLIVALLKRPKEQSQPATPPYSEPATRSPQG